MWNMVWPMLMIIGANTFYNICAKSMPEGINPFAALSVTYLVASAVSVFMFYLTSGQKNLLAELLKMNWTSFVLGFAIVALEFGYINVYRAGWKVSVGSLVANIGLACVLLLAGILLYKEAITFRQLAGMGICAAGLLLISK